MIKVLTLFTLFVNSIASIKDCDPSSVFRPTQLSITPDPPIPGQSVKLTLVFNNPEEEITDGTVTTTLNVNFMPFSPTTTPLCENTACPIITGSNDRSTETIFPDITGIIKSRVTWTGTKGESLLCIDTSFKVSTNNFWNILNTAKNLYRKNKYDIHSLYYSLKAFAENNNLRGIINTITSDENNKLKEE